MHVSAGDVVADSDNDGIPDESDTSESANEVAVQMSDPNTLASVEFGVTLKTGSTSRQTSNALRVEETDILALTGEEDTAHSYPLGLIDFEAELPLPGDVVHLVVPLAAAIPNGAEYRKFKDLTFQPFVVDEVNKVASAPLVSGKCPVVGDAA